MQNSEMNERGDPDWEKSSLQYEGKYCEDPHVSCWCCNWVFGPQLTSLSCKNSHDNKMSLSKSVVEYCAFKVVTTLVICDFAKIPIINIFYLLINTKDFASCLQLEQPEDHT